MVKHLIIAAAVAWIPAALTVWARAAAGMKKPVSSMLRIEAGVFGILAVAWMLPILGVPLWGVGSFAAVSVACWVGHGLADRRGW